MVSKEEILKAIHDHKTTSVREISKLVGASFGDVCAVIGEITLTEISDALKPEAK